LALDKNNGPEPVDGRVIYHLYGQKLTLVFIKPSLQNKNKVWALMWGTFKQGWKALMDPSKFKSFLNLPKRLAKKTQVEKKLPEVVCKFGLHLQSKKKKAQNSGSGKLWASANQEGNYNG